MESHRTVGADRAAAWSSDAAAPERAAAAPIGSLLSLVKETRPPISILALALSISVVSTLASLVVPLFTKGLVDGFSKAAVAGPKIGLLALAFLAQALTGALSAYLLTVVGQRVVAALRDRLWKKLLHLKVPAYDARHSGDMISRMTNDTAALRALITENLSGFIGGVISVVGSVAFLIYLDARMTLLMAAAIPLAVGIMVPIGKSMRRIAKGTMDENARFTTALARVLSEIRLVKSSNAEAREYKLGAQSIDHLYGLGLREGRMFALVSPVMSLVMMALLVAVIGYGGAQVSAGALSAGGLVAFILYLVQTIFPVVQITNFFTQLQKARGATEHLIELLNSPEESLEEGRSLGEAGGGIRFEGVNFAYPGCAKVLHDIDVEFEEGAVTAVVGPSGSGKTTLFSLIERFYEPSSGLIRFGELPIAELSLSDWRLRIGYVPQDSPLMAGSVRNNMLYGVGRQVSDEELARAAAAAYADRFIEELPKGYDTEVGERGIQLSGGQRQRIAIARALLRDPAILMLDEATSSLDSGSEYFVQRALENLMVGRTTLVIAHRLSTVVGADRIVFLEGGRITGSGSHEELVRSHDLYRTFASQQLVAERN